MSEEFNRLSVKAQSAEREAGDAGRQAQGAKREEQGVGLEAHSASRLALGAWHLPPTAWRLPLRALPFIALGLLWLSVVRLLGAQWSVYGQYKYGWAVPVLCLYFLWERARRKAQGARREAQGEQRLALTAYRLALGVSLALCALLFAPVRIVHEANPIWRAASYSLTLLAIVMTLILVRVTWGRHWMRQMVFPVLFFLIAVPWPSGIEFWLVQTFTRWNTALTIEMLGWIGIPALQHGNTIEIAKGVVGVDEACSGIRSFQATFMIALALGELYRLRILPRIGLIVAGVMFAFLLNVGRTTLLTVIAAREGIPAIARWHDPAGVTILVGCFLGLWGAAAVLGRSAKRKAQGAGREEQSEQRLASGASRLAPTALRFPLGAFALAAWLIVVEVGTEFWFRSHERPEADDSSWTIVPPADTNTFRRVEVSDGVLRMLRFDEHLSLAWKDERGHPWRLFDFRWYAAHGAGKRVIVALSKTHRPDHCLPAAGRTLERVIELAVLHVGQQTLPARVYLFNDQGVPLWVFHVLREGGTAPGQVANLRENTSRRLAAAWSGSRGRGQHSMQLIVWGYPDLKDAQQAAERELEKLVKFSDFRR